MIRKRLQSVGFTLVEVIVALAITGTALVALMRLQLISIATADKAHALHQATLVAQEKLNEIQAETNSPLQSEQGSVTCGEQDYTWQTHIFPVSSALLSATASQPLHQVEVRVDWQQGLGKRHLTLATLVADRGSP